MPRAETSSWVVRRSRARADRRSLPGLLAPPSVRSRPVGVHRRWGRRVFLAGWRRDGHRAVRRDFVLPTGLALQLAMARAVRDRLIRCILVLTPCASRFDATALRRARTSGLPTFPVSYPDELVVCRVQRV